MNKIGIFSHYSFEDLLFLELFTFLLLTQSLHPFQELHTDQVLKDLKYIEMVCCSIFYLQGLANFIFYKLTFVLDFDFFLLNGPKSHI